MVLGIFGSQILWKKSPFGKNGQKWPKNLVSGLFKENHNIIFVWNLCKMKVLIWFIDILQKLGAWENFGSQVIAKMVPRPMRFQYSLIVNISPIE